MKIRIKDIAKKANVSVGTVDRVLHHRGQVSEETRALIMKIVDELGYERDVLASTLASRKACKIVSCLPKAALKTDYWHVPLEGVYRAKEEIRHFGAEVEEYFFEFSNKKDYLDKALKIVESEPDGLLLAPIYSSETKQIIEKCEEKGIAYVFINSYIEDSDPVCYIGQDSFISGKLAAKLLLYGVESTAEFLIVNIARHIDNKDHILQRIAGFKQFFTDNDITHTHIYELSTEESDDESVAKVLNEALKFYTNVKGVFVTNSKVYKVASYLKNKNISNIKLIGYDLLEASKNHLLEGNIDFLISQKPEEQAYQGVLSLFNKLVLKKDVQQVQYMPIDIITKENIEYYKNEDHDKNFFRSFK